MVNDLNKKKPASWHFGYGTTMFYVRTHMHFIICPVCFADNLLQKIKTINSPHADGQRVACAEIKAKFKDFDCWACKERKDERIDCNRKE